MSFAAIPGPLATRWVRCIACRRTLSSRGDVRFNRVLLRDRHELDASLAAILTRSACRALSSPLVPGGLKGSASTPRSLAADLRPARVSLLRRAFASKRSDSLTGAVFLFAVHFRVRQRGEIYEPARDSPKKSRLRKIVIHRSRARRDGVTRWTVHKAVERLCW